MSNFLAGLTRAYDVMKAETLSLPHLGERGCTRHGRGRQDCPEADVGECHTRIKEPNYLCVEILEDDRRQLVPLFGPASRPILKDRVHGLVRTGWHPLDIIIATVDPVRGRPPIFRTSVDHLLWTWQDQRDLQRGWQ